MDVPPAMFVDVFHHIVAKSLTFGAKLSDVSETTTEGDPSEDVSMLFTINSFLM